MDETDRKILAAVQEKLPLVSRPFKALGEQLDIDEMEVLTRLQRLCREGMVRRLGPILDTRKLGLSGILAAVQVSPDQADSVAQIINQYQEVSHNYLRPNESGYNLWFTISAKAERIEEILAEIRGRTGLKLLVLPTARIFKIGVKFEII